MLSWFKTGSTGAHLPFQSHVLEVYLYPPSAATILGLSFRVSPKDLQPGSLSFVRSEATWLVFQI